MLTASVFNRMVLSSVRDVDSAEDEENAPAWRQGKACATLAMFLPSLDSSHTALSVSRLTESAAVKNIVFICRLPEVNGFI